MARLVKYHFGEESFTSKDAVKKRASEILRRYFGKKEIPEGSKDFTFVEGLLLNHIEGTQKIGQGIDGLFVAMAPHHPTPCFWIRRVIGRPTDFGVPSCLDSPYQLNRASLRELVSGQIEEYRARRLAGLDGSFVSDYSDLSFPLKEAVVDHDPPFDLLVEQFFAARAENPRTELLTVPTDASSLPVWKQPEMAKSFHEFHSQANLRIVQHRENLSQIKRLQNLLLKKHL